MARFDHLATTPARGPRDILRWRLERARAGVQQADTFKTPVRPNDGSALRGPAASLTWIGHATFALRLGGKLVVVDPIWSQRIQRVIPRHAPPGVAFEQLPPADLVLVTHNHMDHMDLPTLKRFGTAPRFIVPLGNGRLLRKIGITDVVELDWWQSHREGEVEVTLVPARHWSMRMPWTRNEALWGGFVVRGPEGAAYHSGDTAFFDTFEEIGSRCGPLDWAMLPIGAYEPRWFMEPQHMNPEDALEAFNLLGAETFVAMHWGTFKLTDEPLGEPPERIRALWRNAGTDEQRLWVMDVGETRTLGGTR